MSNKTAMQQLLHQMREERSKLPLPIEWNRCYQAIEMMIVNTYLPIEKEQIADAFGVGCQVESTRLIGYHEMAEQYYNETYEGSNYDSWDEVIDQLGDTNEMINHVGEVNEMVDHVPDVRKMVEDDVEKLAEREYREFPSNPKDKTDWLYNRDVNCFKKRKAFIKGYNKAKETLYTKEELMDAIRLARQIVYKIGANDYCNTDEEIIQSLKQPKKY